MPLLTPVQFMMGQTNYDCITNNNNVQWIYQMWYIATHLQNSPESSYPIIYAIVVLFLGRCEFDGQGFVQHCISIVFKVN